MWVLRHYWTEEVPSGQKVSPANVFIPTNMSYSRTKPSQQSDEPRVNNSSHLTLTTQPTEHCQVQEPLKTVNARAIEHCHNFVVAQ